MINDYETLINIIVPVYNQQDYIATALDSILKQKCAFNYLILLGNDCSTDNTNSICLKYTNDNYGKIKLLNNNSNLGLVRNYKNLFDNCQSKYIAILEGDDYWIDPLKLQRQVDILESDNSIGLVHTGSYTLTENGTLNKTHLSVPRCMLEGDLYETLLTMRNTISPMTVLFRRELVEKYADFDYYIENEFKTIDYSLWLAISRHSKIAYIDEPTAVYRSLKKSVSKPGNFEDTETFFQTSLKSKKYYFGKYPVAGLDEKTVLSRTYLILAEAAFTYGRIDKAKYYADKVVSKDFKSRFLKLAVAKRSFPILFKAYLLLLPLFSKSKQLLFRAANR